MASYDEGLLERLRERLEPEPGLSERAMFGSFEARRGYHHGDGGIVRLVNTCGSGVALEMLLTAEPIDARVLLLRLAGRFPASLPAGQRTLTGTVEVTSREAVRGA